MKRMYEVTLTPEERRRIEEVLAGKGATQIIRKRCRIVLDMDRGPEGPGMDRDQCAEDVGVARSTVFEVCKQLATEGLESLFSIKRQPASDIANRKVDPEMEEKLVAYMQTHAPVGRDRWTYESLSEVTEEAIGVKISKDTIRNVFKRRGIILK